MSKIKDYFEYRKNKKIAKRELAKMAATTLLAISELLIKFKEDNGRIFDIVKYIVTLSPEDIQKILIHSIVETIPDDNKTE